MKIIQIADRGCAWHPFPRPAFMMRQIPSGLSLEDFIRLHQTDWDKGDVFVIDVHFTWSGSTLAALDGIRFLKILRLLGFRQHCVLYSFLPLNYLLTAYPHNEILLSKGSTFIQLPDDVDMDLCLRVANQPCEENIYPFFSAEATELLSMRRHSLANWWGLLRVYDVLKAGGFVGEDLPEGLRKAIARDGSYSGMLMNFARFRVTPPQCSLSDEVSGIISNTLKSIWRKNLRVVYVDDQAKEGWAYLLQIILYGQERPDLFSAPDVSGPSLDIEKMTGTIVGKDPDLVILDIRLAPKDEEAKIHQLSGIVLIDTLVGQLLNTCPILVFTASDKRSVSEAALAAGADGIWTKEGLDEGAQYAAEDYYTFSTSRFLALLEQVLRLTGVEFSILYDSLKQIIAVQEAPDTFWWEKARWYPEDNEERTPVDRDYVIQELIQLFRAHKQFLQATLPAIRRSSYDLLTIKICRMLEAFHPSFVGEDGKFITLGRAASESWPSGTAASAYVQHLVGARNNVVHANPLFGIVPFDVFRYKKVLDTFFSYITLNTPAADLGTMSGTLSRSVSRTRQDKVYYNLYNGQEVGVFTERADQGACEILLNGSERLENIEARIQGPSTLFVLKDISVAVSGGNDHEFSWSGQFRVMETNPKWVFLSLGKIMPRKNVRFFLIGGPEYLERGYRLFFQIKWSDWGDKSRCSVYDATLDPSEPERLAYWSATIAAISRNYEGETFLGLVDIEPPLNATFRVGYDALPVLKQALGKSRICFLPTWSSSWELAGMTVKRKDRVYAEMSVIRAAIAGGASPDIRRLATRHDLYVLASDIEQGDSLLFDEQFHGHLVLSCDRDRLNGDVFISERPKPETGTFQGRWIQVGSMESPDWEAVLESLDVT